MSDETPPSGGHEHQQIGARLRAARTYLGLSQEAVAGKLGIPRAAISAMEGGQRKVSGVELRKLARLYGKSVEHLLGDEEDPVLDSDEISTALFRAARQLSETDRRQVLQFAEFLKNVPSNSKTAE